jgi:hypothetical protein
MDSIPVKYYKNMSLISKYHDVVNPLQGLGFKLILAVYGEGKNRMINATHCTPRTEIEDSSVSPATQENVCVDFLLKIKRSYQNWSK